MTADQHQQDQSELELNDSPGALLQQGREQKGLSQREVAEQLRLLPQQIGYLEADEFFRFNGDLFCKAHIRRYAQLLELDEEQLIGLFTRLAPSAESKTDRSIPPGYQVQNPGRGHSLRYWGLGVAGILAVALWLQQPSDEALSVVISEVVDPNDQSSLVGLDATTSPIESAQEEPADNFGESEQEPVVLDLPAGSVAEASMSAGEAADTPDQAGVDKLRFAFTEDCWVEVSDGNGDVIFASLKKAQESLTLTGTGPFKVLLGYAHGVSLNYNGKPIEINVNNRNNSARLVVGNLPVR